MKNRREVKYKTKRNIKAHKSNTMRHGKWGVRFSSFFFFKIFSLFATFDCGNCVSVLKWAKLNGYRTLLFSSLLYFNLYNIHFGFSFSLFFCCYALYSFHHFHKSYSIFLVFSKSCWIYFYSFLWFFSIIFEFFFILLLGCFWYSTNFLLCW